MATVNVGSASALALAISNAQAGDTIVLAPGNYGNVKIANRAFSGPITIISADSSNVAHFDRLLVDKSSNIVFKQLDIGGAPVSTDTYSSLTNVLSSSNITFDSIHFHGSLDGNPTGDKSGLSVRLSNLVKIVNSEFEQLFRGAWFQQSNNIDVSNNRIHDIRSDGLDFSAVTQVVIDGNKFTNFYKQDGDHPDAIQFWSANETTASTDIIIRNNQITQGVGAPMQGIFLKDETTILPYERVLIENNLVYESGMPNGITVTGGKTITMRNNTVVSIAGDAYTTKIRLENIAGASVAGNLTDQFVQLGINSGIVFDNNLVISLTPSYYSLLTDIYDGSTATIDGLVVDGYGYQLPVSSTTASTTTTAPVSTTDTTVATAPPPTTAPTTTTTAPTTTTTDSGTTTTTKLTGWGRGGSRKTASVLEKTAVTTVDTSATALPTTFTTGGLYTNSFYSRTTTGTTTTSAPLTAASANTRLGGSAFRSQYQLFHA